MTFTRDYRREYVERDQAKLKRQRGRAYQREVERARALGVSITAMRRQQRKQASA